MPDKNIHLFLCYTVIAFALAGAEYCSTGDYLTLGDIAKRSPNYYQDAVPLCDRYLPRGWYRAGFHEIPTTAPRLLACGTTYPYWMNGQLPNIQNEPISVKMCRVGFASNCETSHDIYMVDCGNFFVYQLSPLQICSSAYCFKQSASCVLDVPKNIEVKYHNVSWTTNADNTVHDPDVNLECKFDRLSNVFMYYDVTWYVDNTEVLTGQTVQSDIALLSATQMLAKDKKANSMIHCVVGAKLQALDTACKTSSSPLFFAGIKVLTSTLHIPRGGNGEVEFVFTIPFISRHNIYGGQNYQKSLYINTAVHGNSGNCDDRNKNLCETEVEAYYRHHSNLYNPSPWSAWRNVHKVKIYNRDDGSFTLIDKHITLRFETLTATHGGGKIFDGLTLTDVQVFIEDTNPSWKGVICESHTDPHMKTFDGKDYECHLDGTFILYRNEHFEQEVQQKHHRCHPRYPYPRCSCAVAVRSGKDVFIVDICNYNAIINFPSCGDKVLKVIKVNDRNYKVILPTGTLVEIKFVSWPVHDHWQLNVDIFPSPSDVGNSSGLCGILDGDYRNDFTRNNPGQTVDNPDLFDYYTPPNDFSDSWRVKGNEVNFFDHTVNFNLNSISTVLDRVCWCKRNTQNGRSGDIECNYGTYKNCKFRVGKRYHCILNPEGQLRRKRDLRYMRSILSESTAGYECDHKRLENRQKREIAPKVKTYVEAEQICTSAFQNSQSYSTCQDYVNGLSNTSLVNCISDVMMTGDHNFTKIHIQAALEQCSILVALNTTFQQTEPDVTYIIESFCQNNCSGHGVCNSGNCTCEQNFAGSDCSFDLVEPPRITHISGFGLCDKSKETCDEITLFGKYFVEKMNSICYMTRKLLQRDGTPLSTAEYHSYLEERTLFEGYCPLEYSIEDHWITEFTFNISNDGSRYTENFNVYTYQSLCQEFQNISGNITFSFKEGHCYINNTCYADGSTNKENTCDVCNTTSTKYQWSFNPGCTGTTTYQPVTEMTATTESTTSSIEPTTTVPSTATPEPTSTAPEPTTSTPEPTTTKTPKPPPTTPEPTTTTTEQTTSTTPKPTTTTNKPTASAPEHTTTTTTVLTTITTPEPPTTTSTTEPTISTTTEPTTSTTLPTTTTPKTTTTSVSSLVNIVIVPVLACIFILIAMIVTIKIYMYKKFQRKKELYGRDLSEDYRRDFTDESWKKCFDNQAAFELNNPRA